MNLSNGLDIFLSTQPVIPKLPEMLIRVEVKVNLADYFSEINSPKPLSRTTQLQVTDDRDAYIGCTNQKHALVYKITVCKYIFLLRIQHKLATDQFH